MRTSRHDHDLEERQALLGPRQVEAPPVNLKQVAVTAISRAIDTVNVVSFPESASFFMRAYPALYDRAVAPMTYLALPFCAAHLGVQVAAERGNARAEHLEERYSHFEAGANTFYFFLGFYLASYIAVDAAINHLGNREVDTTDAAYMLAFVLPSALAGIAHTYLRFSRASWENDESQMQKFKSGVHTLVRTLYGAGTLNEFILFVGSWMGLSETGDIDPNVRIGMYSSALMAGIGLEVATRRKPSAADSIQSVLSATSAINYLYSLFYKDADLFSPSGRAVVGTSFGVLALLAALSAKLYPKIEVQVQPQVQVADLVLESDSVSLSSSRSQSQRDEVSSEQLSARAVSPLLESDDSSDDGVKRVGSLTGSEFSSGYVSVCSGFGLFEPGESVSAPLPEVTRSEVGRPHSRSF